MNTADFSAEALLQCFFSECERHFRFLEEGHGYSFICGLAEYQNNYKIIKPFNNQKTGGFFSAVTRYEKGEHAIEICFDNRQFLLEVFSFYNLFDRFELSELFVAARKDSQCHGGDRGVTSPELIEKTIQRIADSLKKHTRIILDPTSKLMDRAMTIRSARLEQNIRQRHSDILKSVCEKAAFAYREKDYRRVIVLLEPHKDYLQKADLKKLERAKKHLLPSCP